MKLGAWMLKLLTNSFGVIHNLKQEEVVPKEKMNRQRIA
jgi:hypothetical protein